MEKIGPGLPPDYVKLNWNDHTNSLVYLQALTIGNNYIVLMNMTLVNFGTERDWRGLFFVIVFVMTKMLLLNIFQGFFIAIFLQFYGKQEIHEVKKKAPKVVTKKDFRFEMAKFFVKKSGRKVVEETEGGDMSEGKKEGESEDKKNR
jgi:predicted membrane protein